jgi:serine/threonine protein kinase/Tol biopolymer transport system component
MSLSPGARLGPYEIVAPIGAGGMGQVYRARDTRLDRTVAVKILPPVFAHDPQLRQRFDREARTVGALNHPNICVLHDIGEQEGIAFLVMEYLEGETLASRLARGPLPGDEVIRYGTEIAEALDRAHRHGVIHRDLKPANVMLTRTGAKLLDFGLARPPVESVFTSETRAPGDTPITAEGVLVGTLQYMAPEQLEGRAVDARTDIFALGAVLYEMATGERAFPGDNQASIIAAILNRQPPLPSTRQPLSPPALDHIVWRALAKDPDDRWQTARDVYLELRTRGMTAPPTTPPPRAAISGWLVAGLGLLAIVAGSLASSWLRRSDTLAPAIHAMLAPPERMLYHLTGDYAGPPAVSPDGTAVVFAAIDGIGRRQLWLRRLDSLTPVALPATENATFPFWSPDSRSVGFFADSKLKRIDLNAGSALTLCDAPSGRGGSWNAQGVILFTPSVLGGLQQVAAGGGSPTAVTTTEGTAYTSHRWPQFLPDGRHFLYLGVQQEEGRDQSAVFLGSIGGREPQLVLRSRSQGTYANGYLLFIRDRTLWAQPFDVEREALGGAPVAVARDVLEDPTIWRGIFSVSDTGTLVYEGGVAGTSLTLYDRAGHEIGPVGERGIIFDVNVSPDGSRVAVNRGDPADIWVYELERGTSLRLTFDVRNETMPVWSPDGQQIAFNQVQREAKNAVLGIPASGGASRELIPSGDLQITDWSSNGRVMLLRQGELMMSPGDIWVQPLDGLPRALLQTPFAEYHARFSPNMRWVSYVSNESGRDEVYVMPFVMPAPGVTAPVAAGDRVRVSTAGGVLPRWRRDGRELYYLSPDIQVMAASVREAGTKLDVQSVAPLFALNPKPVGWVFDVMPDGQRFVVNSLGDEGRRPLALVTNWPSGLTPRD